MSIAFVFPGQGSQYIGMGLDLAEKYPAAKLIYNQADEALGMKLSEICFQGPEEELKKTAVTQPAILTTSVACLTLMENEGIKADMVAGHSLGEYSALVAAKSINFNDAVKLVQIRGSLMQEAVPLGMGSMAAVLGLDKDKVREACQNARDVGIVEVANYNCPGQVVISGEIKALEKAMDQAKALGAKRAIPLSVSGPFHSSLMKPAGDKFAQELAKIDIKDPQTPVIANVSADYVRQSVAVRESLIEQVSSSVRWDETIEKMISEGVKIFVEIGPGKVLSGLIKKISKDVHIFNVENVETFENVLVKIKEVL